MAAVNDLVVASADVKGGRLFFRNRRNFDRAIAQFKEGWTVEVSVKRLRATRSQQQNRYWWGVCVQLVSEHTGYTPEEVHEIAKQMFIPKHLAIQNGNGEIKGEFVIGGSTRAMNTTEFGEFMERFREWAAMELDVVIPDPTEVNADGL